MRAGGLHEEEEVLRLAGGEMKGRKRAGGRDKGCGRERASEGALVWDRRGFCDAS